MNPWTYPLDPTFILRNYKKRIRELREGQTKCPRIKLAILSGSTVALLPELLQAFLLERGLDADILQGNYNQYYQDAMFDNQELVDFKPNVIYVHTTSRNIEEWPALGDEESSIAAKLEKEYSKWESIGRELHRKSGATVIQNNFELPIVRLLGNQDGSNVHGRVHFIRELNQKMATSVQKEKWHCLQDLEYLASRFGLERWHDEKNWYAYKYAMSMEAFVELAFELANTVAALYGKTAKIMVTDLDNTLWGGVIGDEGVENIVLGRDTAVGEAYSDVQKYLLALKERGILLAVASKNEQAAAEAGFMHPDSILKKTDFSSFYANWNHKPDNLQNMAQELSLGLESFLFFDDNPAERAWVRDALPEVAVPEIGQDVTQYIRHLDRCGCLESGRLSHEDLVRGDYYQQNQMREQLKNTCTYEDYLRSLQMQAEIAPFSDFYLERITQLINKTNQFNLTTQRHTYSEVKERARSEQYICLYGRLKDRFGDNGIVTALVGKIEEQCCMVELWVMSCRVLKRELEKAMLDQLVCECKKRGIVYLKGRYRQTAKNGLVGGLYETLGFTLMEQSENAEAEETQWLLDVAAYTPLNAYIEVQ